MRSLRVINWVTCGIDKPKGGLQFSKEKSKGRAVYLREGRKIKERSKKMEDEATKRGVEF